MNENEQIDSIESLREVTVGETIPGTALKTITLRNQIQYNVPGLVPNTQAKIVLDLATRIEVESIVYDDETLSRVLLNAVTGTLLLNHVSETVNRDFSGICGNNEKARVLLDRINSSIEQLNKDLMDIVVKIG